MTNCSCKAPFVPTSCDAAIWQHPVALHLLKIPSVISYRGAKCHRRRSRNKRAKRAKRAGRSEVPLARRLFPGTSITEREESSSGSEVGWIYPSANLIWQSWQQPATPRGLRDDITSVLSPLCCSRSSLRKQRHIMSLSTCCCRGVSSLCFCLHPFFQTINSCRNLVS